MRPVLWIVLVLLLGRASAVDLVVHPFTAADPIVGVALADRVAEAIVDVDVVGPELAPLLAAPIVVPGGYLNLLAFQRGNGLDRTGIALLAGVLGVPNAVTGELVFDARGLRLELLASIDGVLRQATIRSRDGDLTPLTLGASAVVAAWIGARSQPPRPLDLTGVDRDVARARTLLGAGFVTEAVAALASLDDLAPRDAAFRTDLGRALVGSSDAPARLAAIVAISTGSHDPAAALARWRAEGDLPVADVWAGAYAVAQDDAAAATAAFRAAERYPFGAAAAAAHRGSVGGVTQAAPALAALASGGDAAALLAGALAAGALGDAATEQLLLTALGVAAPFMTYPFERSSFLAFDRDDALAAARALAIALDLDPDSDLYWTNFGWAQYLLGALEASERASLRAIELDPDQVIARYNLGLVRVVTDRLEAALADYREALRRRSEVDAEAIEDLIAAEDLYPEALGVPYALAFLHDRAGNRLAAAAAFERYAERAAAIDPLRARDAALRAATLRAPLPPIDIDAAPRLTLGRRGVDVDVARPGDPLTLSFEVTTPGDALPRTLVLRASLRDGEREIVDATARVDVPIGAIGFVLDALAIELPVDLPPGTYALAVDAEGDGLTAQVTRELRVAGAVDDLRRLIGRGVVFTAFDGGAPLLTPRDLDVAAATIWQRFTNEIQAVAALAEEALTPPTRGRFAGASGGEIFAATTETDVRDFVAFLLSVGTRAVSVPLVDAYAQWVIDGTPDPDEIR
jgi:tetratricopeptide (TPR) repeat protein